MPSAFSYGRLSLTKIYYRTFQCKRSNWKIRIAFGLKCFGFLLFSMNLSRLVSGKLGHSIQGQELLIE